jgi:hypothetical protein
MTQHDEFDPGRALFVADRIARSSNKEWICIFEELRRQKRLSATVHELNLLLDQPAHHAVAKSALTRMGLAHAG